MTARRSLRRLGPALLGLALNACGTGSPGDASLDARTDATHDGDTMRADALPTDAPVTSDAPRPVIYQLVVRYFSNTTTNRTPDGTIEQNGVGRFEDINDAALASIRAMGFTHVWLTGVIRQATLTDYTAQGMPPDDADVVKGRAGSFYAVRDYFDVCPDYARSPANRLAEFDALVARVHAAGLKVMLDFVPNHVARGYHSVVRPELDFGREDDQGVFFSVRNDFFYLVDPPGQALRLRRPAAWNPPNATFDGLYAREDGTPTKVARATGNRVTSPTPSENDWYETVVLNYGLNFATGTRTFSPTPSVWTKMDQVLAYWQARGVDGFRCDFAHYVPDEAWRYLLSRARERDPRTFLMAEAYENFGGLLSSGFDAVYHDAAYDTLKGIYQGARSRGDFESVMASLPDNDRGRYVHYLENHDERRVASPIRAGGNPDDSGFGSMNAGRQLAPLVYLYGPGPVLVYNGQEVGEEGAGSEGFGGDDGRTTLFDYWSMPAMQGWVNNHRYDGAGLTDAQRSLRGFYADLLRLTALPVASRGAYWGLYGSATRAGLPDGLYPFARYTPGGGPIMVVVANFTPGTRTEGRVKLPAELVERAGVAATQTLSVTLRLDHRGAREDRTGTITRAELVEQGLPVAVEDQAANVYLLE